MLSGCLLNAVHAACLATYPGSFACENCGGVLKPGTECCCWWQAQPRVDYLGASISGLLSVALEDVGRECRVLVHVVADLLGLFDRGFYSPRLARLLVRRAAVASCNIQLAFARTGLHALRPQLFRHLDSLDFLLVLQVCNLVQPAREGPRRRCAAIRLK